MDGQACRGTDRDKTIGPNRQSLIGSGIKKIHSDLRLFIYLFFFFLDWIIGIFWVLGLSRILKQYHVSKLIILM